MRQTGETTSISNRKEASGRKKKKFLKLSMLPGPIISILLPLLALTTRASDHLVPLFSTPDEPVAACLKFNNKLQRLEVREHGGMSSERANIAFYNSGRKNNGKIRTEKGKRTRNRWNLIFIPSSSLFEQLFNVPLNFGLAWI